LRGTGQLTWAPGNDLTAGVDTRLGREAAAILQLGSDAAGTTAYTLKGNDRITSDGVGGDLTIAAGRGRGDVGGYVFIATAATAAAGTAGTLVNRITIDPNGTTFIGNGVGTGALFAGSYYAGSTPGADCTSAAAVTVAKGIVTVCSEPVPDPLTQTEVNDLRGLMAQMRGKQ